MLDRYLSPVPLQGETLRFDLSSYLSKITREMLQMRLRRNAQALGAGPEPIPANVTQDGAELLVDAAALLKSNATVRARLEGGAGGVLSYLRKMRNARRRLDGAAGVFAEEIEPGVGRLPRLDSLLQYLDAASVDQALGSLKFCLPSDVKARLSDWFADENLIGSLLSSEAPSIWTRLHRRELSLAALRLCGTSVGYRQGLQSYQREFGYLFAEDVDFELYENLEAIDRRVATLGISQEEVASARRQFRSTLLADRARKTLARQIFAQQLQSRSAGEDRSSLIALVLLSRAVAQHEDQNRQGKMRLLRDLRDLARAMGLEIARISLFDLAAPLHGVNKSSDPSDAEILSNQ